MKALAAGFSLLLAAAAYAKPAAKPAEKPVLARQAVVLAANFSGVISPVSAEYLLGALEKADRGGFDALVIELDTPGGLDLSMREIVKGILASRVPVIVYVSPSGGRAASAGVFITMAAHVAAMAPGTNIGAAHPVQLGGIESSAKKEKAGDSVMEAKMTNDASAYLQAIAARRGRNEDWASLVVVKSTSIPSAAAVAQNVVDLEAESVEALLNAIDGRKLKDFPNKPLISKGARIERFPMTRRQKLLATVSDPNIAMILMSLGVSGMLIELYSPGLIVPGIVGAVSLILAFYSFQTLSANFAGVLLIMLGLLLYVLELKITSFGLLAVSGTAAILFGSLMMFKTAGAVGGLAISGTVIASTVGTLACLMVALLYIAKKTMTRPAAIGLDGAAGQKARVTAPLVPLGEVQWRGERWRAESLEGTIPAGADVIIDSAEGLTLKVRRRS